MTVFVFIVGMKLVGVWLRDSRKRHSVEHDEQNWEEVALLWKEVQQVLDGLVNQTHLPFVGKNVIALLGLP